MRIIKTHETDLSALPQWDADMIYNGLDCCVTQDVFNAIHPQLDEATARTYEFSKALQGPVLEMRVRGVLVDQARRMEVVDELFEQADILERQLNRIVLDGVGLPTFNWRSPVDLQRLLYHELDIKPIIRGGRPTVDRGAREKIESYPIATQIIKHINALTELGDKLSVLRTAIDPDGRIRTSYNIAGTSTGRFSSSLSEFGTGGNLQNIEESLRSVFIADQGYKFAKCDAKSGESFCVGAIEGNQFGDWTYLNAIESGDIHIFVARLVWPDLGWTGVLSEDKLLGKRLFYRDHTYRDMCKKLGHGSSYGGKPQTLSEQSRIPINLVSDFQRKYFEAFPAHQLWQADVDERLRRLGFLTTLTGRKRWFFGRRSDPSTLREAIAYDPQGSLADIVNEALIKLWRQGYTIVMHDHDALTFMYPEKREDEIIPKLMEALVVPITLANGRTLRIPYDCEVGWNKGHFDPNSNPDGLRAYSGTDTRKRQPIRSILDTIVTKHITKVG